MAQPQPYLNIRTSDNCSMMISSNVDDNVLSDVLVCTGIDNNHISEILYEISKSRNSTSSTRSCLAKQVQSMENKSTQTNESHPLLSSFKKSAQNLLQCFIPH